MVNRVNYLKDFTHVLSMAKFEELCFSHLKMARNERYDFVLEMQKQGHSRVSALSVHHCFLT